MLNVNVCEVFCRGKSEHRENEDGYIVTPAYIAVVDGATSKTNLICDGQTGGVRLKNIIIDTIKGFRGDETMEEAVKTIQERLLTLADPASYGPSAASAIIFSLHREEIWSIGDCRMLLGGKKYYFEKKIDRENATLRSAAVKRLLEQGYSAYQLLERDLAREEILPRLSRQYEFENTRSEYGYCVFNNSTEAALFPLDMICVIPLGTARELILASDGYPEVLPTLEESEQYLSKVLREDPLCYDIYPSTKGLSKDSQSFDDRTYLRVRIL